MSTLRPYQVATLEASYNRAKAGVLRQIAVLPTAAGKTVIFSNLDKKHNTGKKNLILVNQDELAVQAANKLKTWNSDTLVGIEMADQTCSPEDKYVVASVQTLSACGGRRLARFNPEEYGIVIADECDLSISPTWLMVFKHFKLTEELGNPHKITLFGCTATPNRHDKKALGHVYDEIIYTYTVQEGIRDGWLADLRGYRVSSSLANLDNVRTVAGDLAVNQLSFAINTPARNKLVVSSWKKYGEGRQTIVFCADIAHSKAVADEFVAQGVKAEAIWGSDADRKAKIERIRSGETTVITNCQLLTTGFDCWQVSCIIMARPTKSQRLYTQCVGRGLRIPDDVWNLLEAVSKGQFIAKSDCIVIDVCDVSAKHSLLSIPSIVGLPPMMDLKGHGVLEALNTVEKVRLTKPMANLEQCPDLEKIEAYAEMVNLLTPKYSPEVMANSEYRWVTEQDGSYSLNLQSHGKVTIKPSWIVEGKIEDVEFGPHEVNNLAEAFHFGDTMLKQFGKRYMDLIHQNPSKMWRGDPITEKQIAALKRRIKQLKMQEPDWSSMTKKDGVGLHMKLYNKLYKRWLQ